MPWVNEELGRQFAEIADLLELSGADRFRVRAYERARDAIATARVDLGELDDNALAALDGIGTSTARKIVEFREQGEIGMLTELRRQVPPGIVALVKVPGLGPKTARQLHDELGVTSLDDLRAALASGELRHLPGLGARTEENLRAGLARLDATLTQRTPLADVIGVAEELLARVRQLPDVERAVLAGSFRRGRDTIGDLDLLVATHAPAKVLSAVSADALVRDVVAQGDTKLTVLTLRDLQVDVRAVEPASWGAALIYFTGSKAHNVRIRERALRRGTTLSEYGLHARDDDALLAGHDEAAVYAALGLPWISPTLREDRGEVAAAADGTLPEVVTTLRGDLHGHSDWSGDGRGSIDEMAAAAAAAGLEYWAVTDHAEALAINGLTAAQFADRRAALGALADQVDVTLLDGVELNIGVDGELDYDDDVLARFEFCVASVHTALGRDADAQTARIITAMRHPAVHAIGHLTGRKIGTRPGFDVHFDRILEAALETGTALEINASPRRLDLSDEHVRRAVDAGVTLTISSDAHQPSELDNLRFGIATAQRGWASATDVLNCRDLDGLREFVDRKRSGARR
ncbi:MAG: DNA polymerase/3'-5' exonuclease PolX [Actinobacteria bacterium]|nr:DNA polymerase/3'-5' exonuclease PolX [Actinomycetota bacterium]